MTALLQSLSYKELFTGIWILLWIIGYIPYFRDMLKWTTKPHIFSWFIWWLLIWIAFFGQLADWWGSWSWVTWIASIFCFIIVFFAFFHGWKSYITPSDRYAFIWAGIAICIWRITHSPFWSIILVTIIDILWFLPTLRKWWEEPMSETASTYMLNWIKFIFGVAALSNFSLVTVLYPASLVFLNCWFAFLLVYRRKQLLPQS